MDRGTVPPPPQNILYGALELSKNRWILSIQFPDHPQPSLYPITGGDAEGLMVKLDAARGPHQPWTQALPVVANLSSPGATSCPRSDGDRPAWRCR